MKYLFSIENYRKIVENVGASEHSEYWQKFHFRTNFYFLRVLSLLIDFTEMAPLKIFWNNVLYKLKQ